MSRLVLRAYQLVLSPALHALFGAGAGCRFEPSCSRYAEEALREHGPLRGTGLALHRLASCHPWAAKDGWDPVPAKLR